MKDLTERLRSTQNPGLAVRQQAADALERLAAENTALRADYERACGLVAEMHAAAVGEVRGPTLGVVEDIAALRSRLTEAEALLHSTRVTLIEVAEHSDFEEGAEFGVRSCCHVRDYRPHAESCQVMRSISGIDAHLARKP
jgi:hypothetical protein